MSTSFWGGQHDAALRSPPQYRVAFAIIVSLFLWSAILKVYPRITRLIGYPPSPTPHWTAVNTAGALLVITSVSQTIYWHGLPEEDNNGDRDAWILLPNLTLIVILASFIPVRVLSWRTDGRESFTSCVGRIIFGGLAKNRDHRFMDILLADAFTSLALVFQELYYCILLMILPFIHSKGQASSFKYSSWIALVLRLWPFLIRMRQCYTISQWLNMIKYAAALLPPILFTALKYMTRDEDPPDKGEENMRWIAGRPLGGEDYRWLMWLWILSSLISSIYNFSWDLLQDWDIPALKDDWLLYFGVLVTFCGRFYAFLGLQGGEHLNLYVFKDRVVFGFWLFEIFRRAVWVVLRAKTEEQRRAVSLEEKRIKDSVA